MQRFNVGSRVRWVRALTLPEYKNAVGTVEFVIPDLNVEEFTTYDIRFPFGTRTLYSTQIEDAQTAG